MRHRGAPRELPASFGRRAGSWRRLRLRLRLLFRPRGLTSLGARAIQEMLEQLGVLHGHAALGAFRPKLADRRSKGGLSFFSTWWCAPPLFPLVRHDREFT